MGVSGHPYYRLYDCTTFGQAIWGTIQLSRSVLSIPLVRPHCHPQVEYFPILPLQ